jgi:hypothetical protein
VTRVEKREIMFCKHRRIQWEKDWEKLLLTYGGRKGIWGYSRLDFMGLLSYYLVPFSGILIGLYI